MSFRNQGSAFDFGELEEAIAMQGIKIRNDEGKASMFPFPWFTLLWSYITLTNSFYKHGEERSGGSYYFGYHNDSEAINLENWVPLHDSFYTLPFDINENLIASLYCWCWTYKILYIFLLWFLQLYSQASLQLHWKCSLHGQLDSSKLLLLWPIHM